ncbi:class A beta-lactamase [Streptomyces mobaraensis]|uniref:Beta-lactamase n=1 Tax=Streptomyces mobaraensis TaxID=35621 RepID=A0A5N5W933_STRMB|nr:class A beta-lactamase [Streptomyces mobaraensis]KAB7844936.1 class A beta-lactamase [Streptomyces mobaraensis]
MITGITRRGLLTATAAVPLATALAAPAAHAAGSGVAERLRALEEAYHGRIGLAAFDTGSGRAVTYRAHERFALCSTFKFLAAAAILDKARRDAPGLLDRPVHYAEVIDGSPVTKDNLPRGFMTVRELCDATIAVSDNTAGNLLLEQLGGPRAIGAFARTLGDRRTRLDRTEPTLNTNLPGDPRDTTTPAAMARDVYALTVGTALAAPDREQLNRWLEGCRTGDARIRKAMPAGWLVGDKTGTGERGAANDIAVVRPPGRAPLVVAVYTTRVGGTETGDSEIIARAAGMARCALVPSSCAGAGCACRTA